MHAFILSQISSLENPVLDKHNDYISVLQIRRKVLGII